MNNRFTKGNMVSDDGYTSYLLTNVNDLKIAFVFYKGDDAPTFKEVLDKVNALVEASETINRLTYFICTKTDDSVAIDYIEGSTCREVIEFDWDQAAIPGNFESSFSGNQLLTYVRRHFASLKEDVPAESKDWKITAVRNALHGNLQQKYRYVMPKYDEVANTIKSMIDARFPGSDITPFGGFISVRVPELIDLAQMTVCVKRYSIVCQILKDVVMLLRPYGELTLDAYFSAGLTEGDIPRLLIKTEYDWSDMCGIRGGNAKEIQEFLIRVRKKYGTPKYPNPVEAVSVRALEDHAEVVLDFAPNRKGEKLNSVEKLKKLADRYGFGNLEFKDYHYEMVIVHRW